MGGRGGPDVGLTGREHDVRSRRIPDRTSAIQAEQAQDQETPIQLLLDQEFPDHELPLQEFPLQLFPDHELLLQELPLQELPLQELPLQEFPLQEFPLQELPFQVPPLQLLPAASSSAMAAESKWWPKMSIDPVRRIPSRVR